MQTSFISKILSPKIRAGSWEIKRALHGKSKDSFIASNGDLSVFIKFEKPDQALLRLSELGIAPKILYSSTEDELEPFFVQEYVEGDYTTKELLSENYKKIALLIKKYHTDQKLRQIVTNGHESNYDAIVNGLVHQLTIWEKSVHIFPANETEKKHFKKLLASRPTNVTEGVVPVHADIGIANFIINTEKVFLIDWDDIHLSDPLRDIGQFLWEYIDIDRWKDFFDIYGVEFTTERKKRLLWWVSALKLSTAFWYYIYPKDWYTYELFLEDSILIYENYYNKI